MIFAALSEAADRGELILRQGGMCRWHLRRDGVVVIREILVLPAYRERGLGRAMLASVQEMNPGCTVQARCPLSYPSNTFWEHLGFLQVASDETSNTWQLRPR